MNKIIEAQSMLKQMGLPVAQQNEMSALTLLALCGVRHDDDWASATNRSMGVSKDIMAFVNVEYKAEQPYAPNTRETFRRQVLHQFVQAGLVAYNPDIPDLPVNSPRAHYALTKEALQVVCAFGTKRWKTELSTFLESAGNLAKRYESERIMEMVPVKIDDKEFLLSPGDHNLLQALIIEEFAPRFAPGVKVLYLGDTEHKTLFINEECLNKLGLYLTDHSKLPDVVLYDESREWLFLVEAVTSHGPVSPKRIVELEEFFQACKVGKVYVTAFLDKQEFKKHVADVAWETEVWIAENPDHMIHFNGDRFIGPR